MFHPNHLMLEVNWISVLLRLLFITLQNCRDESCATTGAVLGQHEIELVVYTHQLANPGLHDVFKVRVVSAVLEYNIGRRY